MTRTDTHSPANFDPSEYRYQGSFDAWRDYPLQEELARVEDRLIGLLSDSGFEGGNWELRGTCDHCGARMRYVSVWEHIPTGEHIATGETCAAERFVLPDRVAYDRRVLQGRVKAAREAAERQERIEAVLAENEGLADALEFDHYIVRDIKARLLRWGNISEKQIALVHKIVREETARQAARDAEVLVPAPTGRVTFEGAIVSFKTYENDYGVTVKMTVKVEDAIEGGSWLCFVTQPNSLTGAKRGDVVRLTATLKPGRDAHFAVGSRPAKAEIIGRVDEIAAEADALAG